MISIGAKHPKLWNLENKMFKEKKPKRYIWFRQSALGALDLNAYIKTHNKYLLHLFSYCIFEDLKAQSLQKS